MTSIQSSAIQPSVQQSTNREEIATGYVDEMFNKTKEIIYIKKEV